MPDNLPEGFQLDAPPEGFVLDEAPQAPVVDAGESHAPAQLPAGFKLDSEAYGSPVQQAIAGAEGVARGATLGLSDWAERGLGVDPAAMAARKEANPWTSGIGTAVGAGGAAALTGGGSLIAEGLGGGALAGAIGLGTEGAVFGLGNANSEAALGDPDLNAQKVLSHVGWGALGGATFGALFGKLGAFDSKIKAIGDVAADSLAADAAPLIAYDIPKSAGPVKSFSDLEERIAKAQASGLTFELPQKQVLAKALAELPDLENPVIPQQLEALNSKRALDDYRIAFREGDSDVAKAVQNYEGIQKAELTNKIQKTIEALSPEVTPTIDAVQGGNRAIEAFTESYQEEKKALVPMFKMLERINLGPLRADIMPLMETLANKIPAVSRMFEYGEDGMIKSVESFDPKWGLSKAAYNSVRRVFKSLESGAEDPASFQELLNLRGSMDEFVDILAKDQGPAQIRGLKGAFMDYLQNLADDHLPDMNLRNAFKRYAINEQNRQIVERSFGASVGAQDLSFMPKNAVEDVLGKIFRDTETVKAAKSILHPSKFDELLASHLAIVKNNFTKNGVFSSNNFLNYLRRHSAELGEAFSDSGQYGFSFSPNAGAGAGAAQESLYNRLLNLATVSTIIPDSASVNPSGSAKTIMGMIKNLSVTDIGLGALNPKVLMGIVGTKALGLLRESRAAKNAVQEFNTGLVGKSAQQKSLEATKKIIDAVNANLDRAARSIFKNEEPSHAQ